MVVYREMYALFVDILLPIIFGLPNISGVLRLN